MVTRRQLQRIAKEQAEEESRKTRAREESSQRWRVEQDVKNAARARSLLAGELGEALKRWVKLGLRQIKLDENRVWRMDGGEVYGDPFHLGFAPEPVCEATRILLAELKRNGFGCHISSEEVEDRSYQHEEDQVGTFLGMVTKFYLVIDWE